MAVTWTRVSDAKGDGYIALDGRLAVWDNGDGFGSARNSGRWAVEVDGRWVKNVDRLAEAKALASATICSG